MQSQADALQGAYVLHMKDFEAIVRLVGKNINCCLNFSLAFPMILILIDISVVII